MRCRYAHFASRDPLAGVVLERMLAGVSTRRYRRLQEPVGGEVESDARSTSKSSVSGSFVTRTRAALGELMARRLDVVRLAVLMIDGIDLKGRTNVVALGISTDGVKLPLGLWEGSLEKQDRRLRVLGRSRPGCRARRAGRPGRRQGPALRGPRGARGPHPGAALHPPQRAQRARSPARAHADSVQRRLRSAWALTDHPQALEPHRRSVVSPGALVGSQSAGLPCDRRCGCSSPAPLAAPHKTSSILSPSRSAARPARVRRAWAARSSAAQRRTHHRDARRGYGRSPGSGQLCPRRHP